MMDERPLSLPATFLDEVIIMSGMPVRRGDCVSLLILSGVSKEEADYATFSRRTVEGVEPLSRDEIWSMIGPDGPQFSKDVGRS